MVYVEEDLVYYYLFTSQREPNSVPDMDFLCYIFTYFVPFGVIENRISKTNFKCFNGNCEYSSCSGSLILFLYAPAHKGLAF